MSSHRSPPNSTKTKRDSQSSFSPTSSHPHKQLSESLDGKASKVRSYEYSSSSTIYKSHPTLPTNGLASYSGQQLRATYHEYHESSQTAYKNTPSGRQRNRYERGFEMGYVHQSTLYLQMETIYDKVERKEFGEDWDKAARGTRSSKMPVDVEYIEETRHVRGYCRVQSGNYGTGYIRDGR